MDYQIADLKGIQPLWIRAGWSQKFALDLPDETQDWSHSPEEATKVIITDKALLIGYLAAKSTLTLATNPAANLTKNEAFTTKINWNLSSTTPTAPTG